MYNYIYGHQSDKMRIFKEYEERGLSFTFFDFTDGDYIYDNVLGTGDPIGNSKNAYVGVIKSRYTTNGSTRAISKATGTAAPASGNAPQFIYTSGGYINMLTAGLTGPNGLGSDDNSTVIIKYRRYNTTYLTNGCSVINTTTATNISTDSGFLNKAMVKNYPTYNKFTSHHYTQSTREATIDIPYIQSATVTRTVGISTRHPIHNLLVAHSEDQYHTVSGVGQDPGSTPANLKIIIGGDKSVTTQTLYIYCLLIVDTPLSATSMKELVSFVNNYTK